MTRKPELMTENLDGLIQSLELTNVTAEDMLAALNKLIGDMVNIVGKTYDEEGRAMLLSALRADTAKRMQTLLGDVIDSLSDAEQIRYAWLKTEDAALAFTDLTRSAHILVAIHRKLRADSAGSPIRNRSRNRLRKPMHPRCFRGRWRNRLLCCGRCLGGGKRDHARYLRDDVLA